MTTLYHPFVFRVTEPAEVPAGHHVVRLLDIAEVGGQYGEQFRWRLELVESGVVLNAYCNASTASTSKAVKWFAAFMGRRPAKGDVVDLREAIGRLAVAEIDAKSTPAGAIYPRVLDIHPYHNTRSDDNEGENLSFQR